MTKDASLVAIHCGCITACADCATEAKHATRSKECFKCGQPISGYVQVQGDVTASLPPVGELDATAGDSNEDADVDEEDEDEEAEDEEGSQEEGSQEEGSQEEGEGEDEEDEEGEDEEGEEEEGEDEEGDEEEEEFFCEQRPKKSPRRGLA